MVGLANLGRMSSDTGRRRKGRDTSPRSTLPLQRPWVQPRMRLNHTEVVSADELESIHDASLTILERIGMDIWDGESRSLLRGAGAEVDEAGQHVRFPKEMILERIVTAPSEFTLHSWNPEKNLHIGGNWMANGTVGSAPHIVGLDGVRRTGDRVGFDDLLKLAHMLNSIHFVGGYPVEPIDIHASVRHLLAAFDVLTLTDKHIHCYSLGRQKNIDCIEMVRIARGVDDATLDREPSIFTVINSNSPLRIDTPMLQGIIEMASRNQPVVMTPFTLAGAMAPDHARRSPGATERRGPRRHCPLPDRAAGRAGGLRRLHLQRRHAVGRARLRHTGVRAHGDGRRSAGPPIQPSVPQQQRVRCQRRRRPGCLRERVRALGMCHGRRQHDDAWRRLDGGRAARQLGKMVLDADLLHMVSSMMDPVIVDDDTLAIDAIEEVGAGGHFFGVGHTQERYRNAFYKPMISDWRNYESWAEAGSPEAAGKAHELAAAFLAAYEPPEMDADAAKSSKPSSLAASPRVASPPISRQSFDTIIRE